MSGTDNLLIYLDGRIIAEYEQLALQVHRHPVDLMRLALADGRERFTTGELVFGAETVGKVGFAEHCRQVLLQLDATLIEAYEDFGVLVVDAMRQALAAGLERIKQGELVHP